MSLTHPRRELYTFFMKTRLFILCIAMCFLFTCARKDESDLEREDLFTIDYGKMEDELNLIQSSRTPFDTGTKLVMKDGFFYILNRGACKLMKFNSYGDILELYYNEEKNPEPVLLDRETGEGTRSTRRAFSYPFQDIRNFAVSSDGTLLVDDRIPEARREYDEEIDALLDRIVLRFDREGHLLDYLGQEGVGGTPFSFIDRIDVNVRDEIIVTTRNMRNWRVFWFSSDGRPISRVDIPTASLPVPDGRSYSVSLESVFPDTSARSLYLKVDYYGNETDSEENGSYGYISSSILVLNAETGIYNDALDVPVHYRESTEPAGFSEAREKMLYEFLGVAKGQYFFLMSPDEGSYYRLMILDRAGAIRKRVRIELADGSLYYRDMHVTPGGILSALLCLEKDVEIIWWRSDRFIGGEEE